MLKHLRVLHSIKWTLLFMFFQLQRDWSNCIKDISAELENKEQKMLSELHILVEYLHIFYLWLLDTKMHGKDFEGFQRRANTTIMESMMCTESEETEVSFLKGPYSFNDCLQTQGRICLRMASILLYRRKQQQITALRALKNRMQCSMLHPCCTG